MCGTALWCSFCGSSVCGYRSAVSSRRCVQLRGSSVVVLCGVPWAAWAALRSSSGTPLRYGFSSFCGLGQLCGSTLHYSFGYSLCGYWSALSIASWYLFVGQLGRLVTAFFWYDSAAQLVHLFCGLGQLSLQVLGGFEYSFVVTLSEAAWAALCSTSGTTWGGGLSGFCSLGQLWAALWLFCALRLRGSSVEVLCGVVWAALAASRSSCGTPLRYGLNSFTAQLLHLL